MIISNLDKRLTPAQIRRGEQRERNQALVKERYLRAEKAEKQQGVEAPDIIFEGFQEQGLYTYDPRFDESRAAVADRTYLPVKETVIRTDGAVVHTLGPAALQCVKDGLFCVRCRQRQPEDHVIRREAYRRMADMAISVIGLTPSKQCCYCGGMLGIQGDAEGPSAWDLTPEQKQMAGI